MEVRILSGGPKEKKMLYWIINLALAYFFIRFVNILCKNIFGKSIIQILHELNSGKSLDEIQKEALEPVTLQSLNENYTKLFYKLCKLSEKTPLDIFKTARTEKGFGWPDSSVERHCQMWLDNGCKELPNYVEVFLDDGKDYIINA